MLPLPALVRTTMRRGASLRGLAYWKGAESHSSYAWSRYRRPAAPDKTVAQPTTASSIVRATGDARAPARTGGGASTDARRPSPHTKGL